MIRPFTQFLKDNYDTNSFIGCEIGVNTGKNLKNMIETLNPKKMYAIDVDLSNNKFHDDRIKFIEKDSLTAFKYVDDDLDFVYIDGSHTFFHVYNELKLYFPRTKVLVGGHDYYLRSLGVIKAVLRFKIEKGLSLHHKEWDWWFVK